MNASEIKRREEWARRFAKGTWGVGEKTIKRRLGIAIWWENVCERKWFCSREAVWGPEKEGGGGRRMRCSEIRARGKGWGDAAGRSGGAGNSYEEAAESE